MGAEVTGFKDDIKPTLRTLLINNWDATNTPLSSRPSISTGNWDKNNEDSQITLSEQSDSLGQSASGYDYKTPDGPGKFVRSVVTVTGHAVWKNSYKKDGINPKQLAERLASESVRIFMENFNDASFDNLSPITSNEGRDRQSNPTRFFYSVEVLAEYRSVVPT